MMSRILEKQLPEVIPMLTLPDHLRKTFFAMYRMGKATASEVSNITKRARAVESGYLNQLVLMGYAVKAKDGRKTIFANGIVNNTWLDLLSRLDSLTPDLRKMLAGDMLTALENRLQVFERCHL